MWRVLALLVGLLGEMATHPPPAGRAAHRSPQPPATPLRPMCAALVWQHVLAQLTAKNYNALNNSCPLSTAGHAAAQPVNPNVPFWNIKPSLHVGEVMRYRIWLNGRTYCNPNTHGGQPSGLDCGHRTPTMLRQRLPTDARFGAVA